MIKLFKWVVLILNQIFLELRLWIKLIYQGTLSKWILLSRNPTCKISSFQVSLKALLGKRVVIQSGCTIGSNIPIGDYTFINENTLIDRFTKSIGKYCSISYNVKIGLGSHPLHFVTTSPFLYSKVRGFVRRDSFNELEDKGYTIIGNDVLIGANSIILAGVKVGDGAIVAAGSVVTKNVPEYSIVGGVPAKIIKYRFNEDMIDQLKKHKFWEFEPEVFKNDQSLLTDVEKYLEWANQNDT